MNNKLKITLIIIGSILLVSLSTFGIYKGIRFSQKANSYEKKDDNNLIKNSKSNYDNTNKVNKKDENNNNNQDNSINNNITANNKASNTSVNNNEPEKKVNEVAGSYELIELNDGQNNYDKDDIELLKSYGYSVNLEMKEDYTGTLNVLAISLDFKYDENNIKDDEDSIPYIFSNNTITIEVDNSRMVFQKK